MKNKKISIFVCSLMLVITVLPVMGYDENNNYNQCGCNDEITNFNNDGYRYHLGEISLEGFVEPSIFNEPVTVLLSELDWRGKSYNGVYGNWLTSIKNQGQCGSCWAFAAMGTLEAKINLAVTNPNYDLDLSEQYAVSCSDDDGCDGGNAYYAYEYMKDTTYPDDGALPESCFPYTASNNVCNNKCSDWRDKLIKRITDYDYYSDPSNTQIKSLVNQGPVCISFDVYEDFYDYDGGVYEYTWGGYEGGHQVVLAGYSDSGGYWICKNSWGSSWGNSGYFNIKYGTSNIGRGIVTVDFEKLNNPPYEPSNPYPDNHASSVHINTNLNWDCVDPDEGDILTYDVYFGTSSNPPLIVSDIILNIYNPGTMSYGTKYYWKIVAKDNLDGVTSGQIWDFTTSNINENNPPYKPSNPLPENYEIYADINTSLKWDGGDPNEGDTVTYDVYLGTSSDPTLIESDFPSSKFQPSQPLNYDTSYYWKIIAKDNHNAETEGTLWQFKTMEKNKNFPPYEPSNPNPPDQAIDVSAFSTTLSWEGGDPNNNDHTTYDVYLGFSPMRLPLLSSQSEREFTANNLIINKLYFWQIIAKDSKGATTLGPLWQFTTNDDDGNDPPSIPTITGPKTGKINEKQFFEIRSYDQNDDFIRYYLEFEEGDFGGYWTNRYYEPGVTVTVEWTWTEKGDYTIRAKAQDFEGKESDWTTFGVSMPHTFNPLQLFLERVILRFPILEPLLSKYL